MKKLSKEQMKHVKGGDDEFLEGDPTVVRGDCSGGSTGAWTYGHPVYFASCWHDIDLYCASTHGNCYTS